MSEAKSLQGEPIAIKVDGGKVMVNGANVVSTDIETSNGIIHVIDAVILPPSMAKAEDKMEAMDIEDTAVAAGSFKTLSPIGLQPAPVPRLPGSARKRWNFQERIGCP